MPLLKKPSLLIKSESGMVYLPEPVTAQAHRSRPSRATGIVAAWIGVGLEKFI